MNLLEQDAADHGDFVDDQKLQAFQIPYERVDVVALERNQLARRFVDLREAQQRHIQRQRAASGGPWQAIGARCAVRVLVRGAVAPRATPRRSSMHARSTLLLSKARNRGTLEISRITV